MPTKPYFRVRRTVSDRVAEDVFIHKRELKIGSDPENDLVLTDVGVSPVHATIREENGRFWLADIPDSTATILDGRITSLAALKGGQVITIGPYLLRLDYEEDALLISVEKNLVLPVRAPFSPTPADEKRRRDAAQHAWPEREEKKTLHLYWQDRKREAGKIVEDTPLRPASVYGIGKARFNWRPTLDLKGPRRNRHLTLAFVVVALASTFAWFAWRDAYSPGSLSNAHASSEISGRRIALSTVSSCSNCHQVLGKMQDKCTLCHDVPRATDGSFQGFDPAFSKAHREAEIGCIGCHSEHNGLNFRPKDVNSNSCTSCHNDQYSFRGKILGAPHKDPSGSPTVGYIRINDVVTWKNVTGRQAVERFHVEHPYAGSKCGYCHQGTWGTEVWKEAPRAACQACHAVSFTTAGIKPIGPNCVTCHIQHGRDKDLSVAIGQITDSQMRQIIVRVKLRGLESLEDSTESVITPAAVGEASVSFNRTTVGGASVERQGPAVRSWESALNLGGIPWYAWAAPLAVVTLGGVVLIAIGNANRKRFWLALIGRKQAAAATGENETEQEGRTGERKPGIQGIAYPHPEIEPELCIGCYACIEACPHDVLAMNFDEIAVPVAPAQCMDDTGCQTACPTQACIVVNTHKKIPERKVPFRDQTSFMTNVVGVYVVGDVSRVPLIKNAINEGAGVIECISKDLQDEAPSERAEFDVAIIGGGPAGLSAAIMAKHRGLRFIAIEQNKVLSTIQAYPAGKNVNFKPDNREAKGLLALPRGEKESRTKEAVVELWTKIMMNNQVEIHENEACKRIRREKDCFRVFTAKGETGEDKDYTARRVILALGSNGTPRKLGVIGEDNDKVRYKLLDPDNYVKKRCAVVGGGNSAIEAAVALVGYRRDGDTIRFTRDNHVTLLVRTDFTQDLKFGNKMILYDCWDAGRIDVRFRTAVKEIREDELILVNNRKEIERIPNDYVFVRIGSLWPEEFLKNVGITILNSRLDAAKQKTH